MTAPTQEQIAKLPKWAQDYIVSLERSKATAQRELSEYADSTSPSPFSVSEMVEGQNGWETQKRYIQARSINIKWKGVFLTVTAHDLNADVKDGMVLQWWTDEQKSTVPVAFIPMSYCRAQLLSKEAMR